MIITLFINFALVTISLWQICYYRYLFVKIIGKTSDNCRWLISLNIIMPIYKFSWMSCTNIKINSFISHYTVLLIIACKHVLVFNIAERPLAINHYIFFTISVYRLGCNRRRFYRKWNTCYGLLHIIEKTSDNFWWLISSNIMTIYKFSKL
jgi:hypothetical protein